LGGISVLRVGVCLLRKKENLPKSFHSAILLTHRMHSDWGRSAFGNAWGLVLPVLLIGAFTVGMAGLAMVLAWVSLMISDAAPFFFLVHIYQPLGTFLCVCV
jgi:hypothetical protein